MKHQNYSENIAFKMVLSSDFQPIVNLCRFFGLSIENFYFEARRHSNHCRQTYALICLIVDTIIEICIVCYVSDAFSNSLQKPLIKALFWISELMYFMKPVVNRAVFMFQSMFLCNLC